MSARTRSISLVLTVVACTALTACGNDTDSAATQAEVTANLANDVMAPQYARLSDATAAVAAATKALCPAADAASVQEARAAWTRAWRAWNRTRAFRFGPVDEFDGGADVAYMVDSEKIDDLLTADGKSLTVDALWEKGADVRGLGATEHLLFTRDPRHPKVCAYAGATAALTAQSAHDIGVAWTDGHDRAAAFRDQLARPGKVKGRYLTPQAGLGDLVNGLSMTLTETARDLAKAAEAEPGARDTFGGQGGSRLRDMMWSARASYFGTTSGTDGAGVGDLVAAVSPTADKRASGLIERADAAIASLRDSLDDASPAELKKAYAAAREAGTVIRAEVASELGVTLSLGDADGDS